jgi:hypothetical protein
LPSRGFSIRILLFGYLELDLSTLYPFLLLGECARILHSIPTPKNTFASIKKLAISLSAQENLPNFQKKVVWQIYINVKML